MNKEAGANKVKDRLSEIDNYLKKEYDDAGVKPIVTEFYGLEFIVPYSYVKRNPDLYLDSFTQDFLGTDYDSYDRIASEYEAKGQEIKFTNIDGEEVPVPYLYESADISERSKQVLMLQDACAKYKKAVVLTALTNKLTGDNELVNVRQNNVDELYEIYDANRDNKSIDEKVEQKTFETFKRLGRPKINLDMRKTVQYAAAAGAAILVMTNIAKTDKPKKYESDNLTKNEIEFIHTGSADALVEKYDENKEYEIKGIEKEATQKAIVEKKEEVKQAPKPLEKPKQEVKKEEPKKAPQLAATATIKAPDIATIKPQSISIKIKAQTFNIDARANELLDLVIHDEGLYGTTKKEINHAKKEKAKLEKAGKKVPYEIERNASAKPIDQRTFAGVTNPILKAYHKKHPDAKKYLPSDVIYLKNLDEAKIIMNDLFHDHYKIGKIEDKDLAYANFDALVNLSSKGRREVLQKAVEDVAVKHNKKAKKDERVEVPGNWAETVATTNKLAPKYKNELGNTILDYRDSYVSKYSHDAYKKGLHARNDGLRERFKDVQYAGNNKSKNSKERS